MVEYTLDLVEQMWTITIPRDELRKFHLRLLCQLREQALACESERYIVFLVGPPGLGKTTIAALWALLDRRENMELPFQALPMDGFHHSNAFWDRVKIRMGGESVPLRRVKWVPESFDLPALQDAVRRHHAGNPMYWPRYGRIRHDPVPDHPSHRQRNLPGGGELSCA